MITLRIHPGRQNSNNRNSNRDLQKTVHECKIRDALGTKVEKKNRIFYAAAVLVSAEIKKKKKKLDHSIVYRRNGKKCDGIRIFRVPNPGVRAKSNSKTPPWFNWSREFSCDPQT